MKISQLVLKTLRPETVIKIEEMPFVDRARALPGVIDASESLFDVPMLDAEAVTDVHRLVANDLDTEERQIVTEKFILVGGLRYDHNAPNPLKDYDGEGMLFHAGRRGNSEERAAFFEAFGLNPDGEKDFAHPAVVELLAEMVYDQIKADRSLHQKLLRVLAAHEVPDHLKTALHRAADWGGDRHAVSISLARTRNYWDLSKTDQEKLYPVVDMFEELKENAWNAAVECGLIGNNFAVPLDIYEHGGIAYSISGEGMQCRWDTTSVGAVWVPDECALDNIQTNVLDALGIGKIKWAGALGSKTDPLHAVISLDGGNTWQGNFKTWRGAVEELIGKNAGKIDFDSFNRAVIKAAEEYCRGCIETYNSWVNGENYGVCIYAIDRKTGQLRPDLIDHDVWGYIGRTRAESELESEMLLQALLLGQRTH
jgi:hypothetical protein